MEQKTLKFVYGNTETLAIPLTKVMMGVDDGDSSVEAYVPPVGSDVDVVLRGRFRQYTYVPVVDGSTLHITESGTLPIGTYDVVVVVAEPGGTLRRGCWNHEVSVVEDGASAVEGAIFLFGKGDKGDKGDAFTYDDFTQEQIAELQQPDMEGKAECEAWLAQQPTDTIIADITNI